MFRVRVLEFRVRVRVRGFKIPSWFIDGLSLQLSVLALLSKTVYMTLQYYRCICANFNKGRGLLGGESRLIAISISAEL